MGTRHCRAYTHPQLCPLSEHKLSVYCVPGLWDPGFPLFLLGLEWVM